jgi:hypothetical protein
LKNYGLNGSLKSDGDDFKPLGSAYKRDPDG